MSRPTCSDQDIVAMLQDGATTSDIKATYKVGTTRITRVRAELTGGPQPPDDDDVDTEPDEDEAPETVTISAEYLRALEAVIYLVEQNQRLHLAVARG